MPTRSFRFCTPIVKAGLNVKLILLHRPSERTKLIKNNKKKVLIALGLIHLTLSPSSTWKTERTTCHTSNYLTVPWALSLLFVLSAPFIKNNTITPTVPWFVVPTVGCSIIVIGTIYWVYWFKIWPLFGYNIEHHVEVLPDGSERVRYVVSGLSSPFDTFFAWS